jgi:uncharacterized membrane protein
VNDHAKAVVAHLTLIGWIVALVLNSTGTREPLTSFYLRQYLGIMITGFLIGVVSGWLPLAGVLSFVVLFAWVYNLVGAIKAESWPLPWVGEPLQRLFRGL